jgi:hypothetical protein
MFEEGMSTEQLEQLAERRDDDLCDVGTVSTEEVERMQMAALSSQEYAQLYASSIARGGQIAASRKTEPADLPPPLDDMDTEELVLQTMPDRQKLAELGKLVGTARYALEGHDSALIQDTRRKMERIARLLPEKYRGPEIVSSAFGTRLNDARLSELYLSRAYKLLDEEYADIPAIERTIRDLQQ